MFTVVKRKINSPEKMTTNFGPSESSMEEALQKARKEREQASILDNWQFGAIEYEKKEGKYIKILRTVWLD